MSRHFFGASLIGFMLLIQSTAASNSELKNMFQLERQLKKMQIKLRGIVANNSLVADIWRDDKNFCHTELYRTVKKNKKKAEQALKQAEQNLQTVQTLIKKSD